MKTARASAKTLTLVVSSYQPVAFCRRTTVQKRGGELETCRLKKASPLGKITECRHQRQSRGKDVFMTIETPHRMREL